MAPAAREDLFSEEFEEIARYSEQNTVKFIIKHYNKCIIDKNDAIERIEVLCKDVYNIDSVTNIQHWRVERNALRNVANIVTDNIYKKELVLMKLQLEVLNLEFLTGCIKDGTNDECDYEDIDEDLTYEKQLVSESASMVITDELIEAKEKVNKFIDNNRNDLKHVLINEPSNIESIINLQDRAIFQQASLVQCLTEDIRFLFKLSKKISRGQKIAKKIIVQITVLRRTRLALIQSFNSLGNSRKKIGDCGDLFVGPIDVKQVNNLCSDFNKFFRDRIAEGVLTSSK